jgi:Family of unknown function (DUF6527)
MSRAHSYRHEFVRSFPDRIEEGVLYVSVEFGNTAHRCMCGCGQEVYARLSPRDWLMIYDGETVSLDPSIGNWSFPCQSHYWLERGSVSWAAQWSREQVERGRALDRIRKGRHYDDQSKGQTATLHRETTKGLVGRFFNWLSGR